MKQIPAILIGEASYIKIPIGLEVTSIQFSEGIFDDITIHDFLISKVLSQQPTVLIIPASLGLIRTNYWGFRIAMHLRLTEALGELRYIPIILVSDDPLEQILTAQNEKLGVLCTTPGSILVRNDEREISKALRLHGLTPIEYSAQFLKAITINRPESTGKHSLANQWGAYALDRAAGTKALRNNTSLMKARKQLYFKYVEATHYNIEKLNRPPVQVIQLDKSKADFIEATGKKILLIDDEADKGWSDVLRIIFKTTNPDSDFVVINKRLSGWSSFTEDDKKIILETGFDLFLIDLRLTGNEEEEAVEPGKFSGTDIMRQIKQYNKGNQVIMFTASNKAWNLKALLDFGADGYYIKESPEYNFSKNFSNENFKNFKKEAELCLKYSFLRIIWETHKSIKNWLNRDSVRQKYNDEQLANFNQIVTQLTIAYRLLQLHQSQSASYFVVTYVRILEILSEMFVVVDEESRTVILNGADKLFYCFWNQSLNEYELQSFDAQKIKWNSYKSIANQTMAIACQQLSFDVKLDKSLLRQVFSLIKRRNDFVHAGKEVRLNLTVLSEWAEMMKKLLTSL